MAKCIRIVLILLGIAALVLKPHYSGSLREVVWSYGGNTAVSFSVYFLMTFLPVTARSRSRLLSAGLALLVVQLFEATDGFDVMSNVVDSIDFFANAVGVGLALAVDTAASQIISQRFDESRRSE